jgi:hypothetical protein
MTEDEAKTKWCPFFRATPHFENDEPIIVSNRLSFNDRNKDGRPKANCIGSKCMAWGRLGPGHMGPTADYGCKLIGEDK